MAPARERALWADIAVGLLAGLVATQVTNYAQGPLRRMTPASVRRHERRVRPGASSSLVAARKLCEAVDVPSSQPREALGGQAIHLATGMAWGPVYGLLRRYGGLPPVGAALASGAAMSLILDETLVPALGLSAPCHRYLPLTRIRGLVAHLIYGGAAALAAEGMIRAGGRRRTEERGRLSSVSGGSTRPRRSA
ncbi:MAG: hypothetical protein INR70_04875 [Parafilimonas terrae]|nr:hypothetical protein [Parafilimonas terrae]